jgi:hypothetical protein
MNAKKIFSVLAITGVALANVPEFNSWLVNCDGTTGYQGILADVQEVNYDTNNVYVESTGIPSHSIGPWQNNPNQAQQQSHVFRIPRTPQPATNHIDTPLGPIGVFVNGVPMFNAEDAFSWQNQGIWHRNAIVAEAISFDSCLGHPQMTGVYHYHKLPECLQGQLGDNGLQHSPIIGWAFDGYPVYGPYGYDNPTDPGSSVRPMVSGYVPRFGMMQRDSLPDGTQLPQNLWGPPVSGMNPLGMFVEDFELTGTGDLDEFNVRFCVTPDYPGGTIAYFTPLDSSGESAFPYIVGLQYYGVPDQGNFGPGNVNVPNNADTFEACAPPPTNYCTTSPNSVGTGAIIGSSGTTSMSANDLTLLCWGLVPNTPGLFYYGTDRTVLPLGEGVRCVDGNLIRLSVKVADMFGTSFDSLDLNSPPFSSGLGAVTAGDLRNFQYWYRDITGGPFGYNLSDALEVNFVP